MRRLVWMAFRYFPEGARSGVDGLSCGSPKERRERTVHSETRLPTSATSTLVTPGTL